MPDLLQNAKKIMEAVDKDHDLAIIIVEASRPILFDKNYLARFQNTYSAHIVTYWATYSKAFWNSVNQKPR